MSAVLPSGLCVGVRSLSALVCVLVPAPRSRRRIRSARRDGSITAGSTRRPNARRGSPWPQPRSCQRRPRRPRPSQLERYPPDRMRPSISREAREALRDGRSADARCARARRAHARPRRDAVPRRPLRRGRRDLRAGARPASLTLGPAAHDRALDWWATALDRHAQSRPCSRARARSTRGSASGWRPSWRRSPAPRRQLLGVAAARGMRRSRRRVERGDGGLGPRRSRRATAAPPLRGDLDRLVIARASSPTAPPVSSRRTRPWRSPAWSASGSCSKSAGLVGTTQLPAPAPSSGTQSRPGVMPGAGSWS